MSRYTVMMQAGTLSDKATAKLADELTAFHSDALPPQTQPARACLAGSPSS
jgi:hypothetical protein